MRNLDRFEKLGGYLREEARLRSDVGGYSLDAA